MFARGFLKTAKRVKLESAKKDPNARPQHLYPVVPENFDGWPDKTAATTMKATGLKLPAMGQRSQVPQLKPQPHATPPKQPHMAAAPLGQTQGNKSPLGLRPFPVTTSTQIGKPPGSLPPGVAVKDQFGRVKTAARKPLFGKLKINAIQGATREKYIGPQMQTEPLGATMPNQGTGGGITGGYGSN